MKFLVDNQLPLALARHLESRGLLANHVAEIGLDRASDDEIWQYAIDEDYSIVSKDEDFLYLSVTDPDGPSFVWVRIGNCRKNTFLAAFDHVLPDVVQALQDGQKVVEIQ